MLVGDPSNMIFGVERPKYCRFPFKVASEEGFFKGLHEVRCHKLEPSLESHDNRRWRHLDRSKLRELCDHYLKSEIGSMFK